MELSLTSALSLFVLISLSTVIFFAAKKFKLPYTVMLVLVGLLLVPLANLPYVRVVFGFIDDLVLTPELLFYIFLPILIFESGFNMSMRKMLDNAWAISLLSVVALVVSTAVTAALMYYGFRLIGIEIPFIFACLFGAAISPTDPVAALSLFKECGVPRRLALVFEGESLLNDGTAMALFLVVLGVATQGFHGAETILHGLAEFIGMIVLGVVIGLTIAAIFSRALRFTKNNHFVTVTLLVVSAHMVFIIAEVINSLGVIHVSSIIATTVAALFLGNYSRNILPPKVDNYLGKLVEHMAFVVNSLVFLLAGLLFATSGVNFGDLWLPIVVTILVVATARAISVYAVIVPLNVMRLERHIPASWQKLLAWASLRGALSIIIVLLIPEDFMLEGWSFAYSPRELLLALIIGCILATLFIKAPLIVPLMRRFGISENDPLKDAHEADLGVYYLLTERARLLSHMNKGFLNPEQYGRLVHQVEGKLAQAEAGRRAMVDTHGRVVFDQSLHLAMVHIELSILKRLRINDEVSEKIYRRIHNKLTLQQEKIEQARHNDIDPSVYTDRKDVFDRLVAFVQSPFDHSREDTLEQRLEYYRAQMIMGRKAVQIIESMQAEHGTPVFLEASFEEVTSLYRRYKENSAAKADALIAQHEAELSPYLAKLAERSLSSSGARALAYLSDKGLVDEHTEQSIIDRCSALGDDCAPRSSAAHY